MLKVECPSCEENIRIPQQPKMGLRVKCPHCKAQLKVIEVRPVELDFDDEEYVITEDETVEKPWRRNRGAEPEFLELDDDEDEDGRPSGKGGRRRPKRR